MTAPLILKLEAALREATDVGLRGELVAQIASYKARTGEFAEAEALRSELRAHFSTGKYERVSVRLMALDALFLYYSELSPKARDRMLRANLIAGALRLRDLQTLTASWLAHIDFNLDRFTEMAKWLAECFDHLETDDGSAELRASLVLGDSFQFAAMDVPARLWYERARRLASQLGDQAAFGALTYNRAALHVAASRLSSLTGGLSIGSLALVDGEVRSAINYQLAAGLRSLDHLLGTSLAGLLVLQQDWGVALDKTREILNSQVVSEGSAAAAILLADEALCLAKQRNEAEAADVLDRARQLTLSSYPSEDRAVIAASLAAAYAEVGDRERQLLYEAEVSRALAEHQSNVEGLQELLLPYLGGPACK
jgi:hypothetical protein